MATKLNKPVTRVVDITDVYNHTGEVAVTMTGTGIVFSKGRRKFGVIPWASIAKLSALPGNFPAKFMGNPMGWLIELSQ